MKSKILSVKAKEKGLVVLCAEGENDQKIKYTITEGTYRKIGCPLSDEFIDGETLLTISEEDEARRAMSKALSVLSYADNNEKMLFIKLIRAGFSREAATAATEECVRRGYIDEHRQIEHIILSCASNLLGPRKIMQKLLSKNYQKQLSYSIMKEMEERGDIDFEKMRTKLLETKLPENPQPQDKRKLLYRYGYLK